MPLPPPLHVCLAVCCCCICGALAGDNSDLQFLRGFMEALGADGGDKAPVVGKSAPLIEPVPSAAGGVEQAIRAPLNSVQWGEFASFADMLPPLPGVDQLPGGELVDKTTDALKGGGSSLSQIDWKSFDELVFKSPLPQVGKPSPAVPNGAGSPSPPFDWKAFRTLANAGLPRR